MNGRDILSWLLALTIVGAIVAGAFLTLAVLRPDAQSIEFEATDVTGVTWGRDFHLTGSDGKPHQLAEFRGKVVALYFGYTRCADVCPLTMATLGEALRLLGDDGKRVQGVFVTVDPRHDKPKALTQYVRSFHEDFLALYGSKAETARTAGEFRVEPGEHHSTPVFLIDPSGRLRLVARAETSAASIAHDIRALLQG
jgi:protein SCO1/2